MRTEYVRDEFLCRGRVEDVAVVAVPDAKHLFAVIVIASALAPQIRRLKRGHQHRNVAGALLFLVDDVLDLSQHLEAEGQPGVDAGRGLLDHARAKHVAVR